MFSPHNNKGILNCSFRTILFIAIIFIATATTLAKGKTDRLTITISNPARQDRTIDEMIEVDAKCIPFDNFIILSSQGDTLSWQRTYDGKIIFLRPEMNGRKESITVLHTATAINNASSQAVYGRMYPERQNDFSFENDLVAYRIYGPGTSAKGEKLYGYDIFLKRKTGLTLDNLYAKQCDNEMWNTVSKLRRMGQRELADDVYQYGFCYHVDHGEGMDIYKVGSTLGAGTNALMHKGEIIYPWCFQRAELLDSGPLRLTVRLTFPVKKINGTNITEVRLLSIDKGSRMVRAMVTYEELPATSSDYSFICGIAVHKENPSAYLLNKENGCIAYEDLGDPDIYRKKDRAKLDQQKGHTFIGCIMPSASDCRYIPFEKETSGATGHVIATSSKPATYYFGYAWDGNENPAIRSLDEWQDYLNLYSQQLKHPLRITISK